MAELEPASDLSRTAVSALLYQTGVPIAVLQASLAIPASHALASLEPETRLVAGAVLLAAATAIHVSADFVTARRTELLGHPAGQLSLAKFPGRYALAALTNQAATWGALATSPANHAILTSLALSGDPAPLLTHVVLQRGAAVATALTTNTLINLDLALPAARAIDAAKTRLTHIVTTQILPRFRKDTDTYHI